MPGVGDVPGASTCRPSPRKLLIGTLSPSSLSTVHPRPTTKCYRVHETTLDPTPTLGRRTPSRPLGRTSRAHGEQTPWMGRQKSWCFREFAPTVFGTYGALSSTVVKVTSCRHTGHSHRSGVWTTYPNFAVSVRGPCLPACLTSQGQSLKEPPDVKSLRIPTRLFIFFQDTIFKPLATQLLSSE